MCLRTQGCWPSLVRHPPLLCLRSHHLLLARLPVGLLPLPPRSRCATCPPPPLPIIARTTSLPGDIINSQATHTPPTNRLHLRTHPISCAFHSILSTCTPSSLHPPHSGLGFSCRLLRALLPAAFLLRALPPLLLLQHTHPGRFRNPHPHLGPRLLRRRLHHL